MGTDLAVVAEGKGHISEINEITSSGLSHFSC